MLTIDYWDDNSPLCCCEYYDKKQQRSHILGCCCYCDELDTFTDNLLCCKGVSMNQTQSVLSRVQDRLRIPWSGGARQISLDAVAPIFLVPILLLVAAYNIWMSFAVIFFTIIFLIIAYKIQVRNSSTTKFFVMWTVTSIAVIWYIFEFEVQPFLEITLEENVVFNILFNGAIFCIYKARSAAAKVPKDNLSAESHNGEVESEMLINVENDSNRDLEEFCPFCKCKKTERTVHCTTCQQCYVNQDFHNVWFDCCISKHNRRYFLLFLILGVSALLYGSNLTLTTVCYSFRLYKTILLPSDCGDVYEDLELAACFVCGCYALGAALFLLWFLIQQCWFISLGITGSEWRRFSNRNRYGIFMAHRPYSKGFLKNWVAFILNY